jgi:hypothetical protein
MGTKTCLLLLVLFSFASLVACDGAAPVVSTSRATHAIIAGAENRMLPAVGAILNGGQSFCTGTLLAPKVVLTAAHCIDSARSANNLAFRIELPANNANGYEWKTYAADPSLLTTHPNWDASQVKNGYDIGFVILKEAVEATDAKPLPWNADTPIDQSYVGQSIQFLGYGLVVSTKTQVVRAQVKMGALIPIEAIRNHEIVTRGQGTSICHGDSGGPALLQMQGAWTVVGVNSYVTGTLAAPKRSACDGTGVPIRTDSYKTYIQSIMQQYASNPCTTNEHCDAGKVCDTSTGACIANPCGDGVCNAAVGENCGTCAQDCGCVAGQVCQANVCIATQQQNPCGDGVCNAAAGENCGTCAQDCGCAAGQVCQANVCVSPTAPGCQSDAECQSGQVCQNGQCVATPVGYCQSAAECQPGQICQNNQCVASQVSSGCQSDAECQSGQLCQNNQCVAAPTNTKEEGTQGGPCYANGACKEGLRCYVSSTNQRLCLPPSTPANALMCPLSQRATSCDPTGQNCSSVCLSANGAGCQSLSNNRFPALWWCLLLLLPLCLRRR